MGFPVHSTVEILKRIYVEALMKDTTNDNHTYFNRWKRKNLNYSKIWIKYF